MKLYSEGKSYALYQGNMLDMTEIVENNSVDSIVTDPPYELGFMGKSWDSSGIAFQKETWEKCYQVLKPGGYMLVFGGTRTFHRIACAIEDAGFEIRDTIMWLYSSGFPKSMNIGLAVDKKNGVESEIVGYSDMTMPDFRDVGKKQKEISGINKLTFWQIENSKRKEVPIYKAQNEWAGWGTQLKPSYEPIIVARKPVENSVVENITKYGVGGLNIDECRIPANKGEYDIRHYTNEDCFQNKKPKESKFVVEEQPEGRFPANVITDGEDSTLKYMPNTGTGNGGVPYNYSGKEYNNKDTSMFNGDKPQACSNYNDSGSAGRYFKVCSFEEDDFYETPQRYYYCSKANKNDRNAGLDSFNPVTVDDGRKKSIDNPFQRGKH